MKRRHVLIAGLALLALTNAVALGGAVWNRSGDPEARLRLSERELQRVEGWYANRENSGLSLRLRWRVLTGDRAGGDFYALRYGFGGGSPDWLDRAKMESLGFDTSMLAAYSERARRRYEKQLPREALLVLELDGPAYRRALEVTRERVERELAKPFAAGDKGAEERRRVAREALDWETARGSRLFVVDAGPDADALRAKYPDRARYAVVRGEVRPAATGAGAAKAAGHVDSVSVPTINVPLRLRDVLAGVRNPDYGPGPGTPFEATLAWGRRLEPWLIEAARK